MGLRISASAILQTEKRPTVIRPSSNHGAAAFQWLIPCEFNHQLPGFDSIAAASKPHIGLVTGQS